MEVGCLACCASWFLLYVLMIDDFICCRGMLLVVLIVGSFGFISLLLLLTLDRIYVWLVEWILVIC